LDAEYKHVVLREVTQMCTNLNTEEQHQLLKLLQKYEHLFDGTLGEFNMDPIGLDVERKLDYGANLDSIGVTLMDGVDGSFEMDIKSIRAVNYFHGDLIGKDDEVT
jgi:hypothetical protein